MNLGLMHYERGPSRKLFRCGDLYPWAPVLTFLRPLASATWLLVYHQELCLFQLICSTLSRPGSEEHPDGNVDQT